MTTGHLILDLKADEGLRLSAYPDPLTGAEPWTIGYGATGPTITKHTVWTQSMADADLARRVNVIIARLTQLLPWFSLLDGLRQDVLVNMAYNLGIDGLLGFHHTLGLIQGAHYAEAADAMLQSKWARQVPNRAHRLAEQMKTGVHA